MFNRGVDLTTEVCVQKVRHCQDYMKAAIESASSVLAGLLLQPDVIESYSFERGMASA